MEEYHQIQQSIDEITGTTAERRHQQQREADEKRTIEMEEKKHRAAVRKILEESKK